MIRVRPLAELQYPQQPEHQQPEPPQPEPQYSVYPPYPTIRIPFTADFIFYHEIEQEGDLEEVRVRPTNMLEEVVCPVSGRKHQRRVYETEKRLTKDAVLRRIAFLEKQLECVDFPLLHYASEVAEGQVVDHIILHMGHDVHRLYENSGRSALHYAAYNARFSRDVTQVLLKYGAPRDLKDNAGKTALDIARKNGFHHTADFLVSWVPIFRFYNPN